jgi:carboxymethylenebutenolidase
MSKYFQLTAADGHSLSSYVAEPAGTPRGGIVVVQEIFGVNSHIRSVADGYAADGYLAIAPAIFDRVTPSYEAGYNPPDIQAGMEMVGKLNFDDVLKDVGAAVEQAKAALGAEAQGAKAAGKVGLVGFCYGGTVAWLAAARLPGLSAVVAYYGGYIANFINEQPKVPVLLHFGEHDQHPAPDQARAVVAAHPEVEAHFYNAGHGFNCDQRGSFEPESANTARRRSLEFFRAHVG